MKYLHATINEGKATIEVYSSEDGTKLTISQATRPHEALHSALEWAGIPRDKKRDETWKDTLSILAFIGAVLAVIALAGCQSCPETGCFR